MAGLHRRRGGDIVPSMKLIYTAEATAHGGREGSVRSSDGVLDLALRRPKELGGPGGAGTNPEQLFAAGYSACFESALRLVARLQKKPLTDAEITARVTLNVTEDKKYRLSVTLQGKLTGVSREEAMALMHAAHEVCPCSARDPGNVPITVSPA